MKKISVILFVLSGFISLYSQSWNIVSQPDIKNGINALYFLDANEGYFVGDNSLVLHTTDGGTTLTQLTIPATGKSLKKVFFTDKIHGFAGSLDGYIYNTTDGGASWNSYNLGQLIYPQITIAYFDALYFTSATEGYVVAGKSKADYIFKTTNGGASWAIKDSLVSTTAQRWYDISFYDANKGVVIGDKKTIEKYTTNAGNNWTLSTPIPDNFFNILHTVKWLSPTTLITMGEGNDFTGVTTPIYKSTDGGINWVKKTQNVTNYDRVKDSYFKNANEGIGVGSNGFSKMYYTKTSDGGETWTPYQGNFAMGLQAVAGIGDVLYSFGYDAHILKSTDFGSTWSCLKNKTPTMFVEIQFIGGKGYAVNRTGDFYINDDGLGTSWRFVSTSGIWDTYAMRFTSVSTGFILKANRHIVKTTDGGQTWNTVLAPTDFNSRSIVGGLAFPDASTGYAWTSITDYSDYNVYKTTDGGNNWTNVYSVSGPGYISGNTAFYDANTGILAGPKQWIQRTTNGGVKWDTAVVNNFPSAITSKDCEDISIIDDSHAWIIGNKFILNSTDKGKTWNYIDHGLKGYDTTFYRISFSDVNNGYIVCSNGLILKTTNGGAAWSVDTSLYNDYFLYAIAFNSKGKAIIGTSLGYILSSDLTTGVIDGKNGNTVNGFVLKQNYPNPFNPSTIIGFELKTKSHVTLKVFDIMGREVATLINGDRAAGAYNITFNAQNTNGKFQLASGVYYYRLQTENSSLTKKMILLR